MQPGSQGLSPNPMHRSFRDPTPLGKLHGSSDALALAAPRRSRRGRSPWSCASALAAQRSPTRSRGSRRAFASRCSPTGRRCPTITFSPHQDLVSERLATLYHVTSRRLRRAVVAATTALYRLAPPSYLAGFTFFLKQGDATRRRRAARAARARRLQHVTQVVSPGEFSVRGGLIDLFPMGSALPYRLDLFDDEIEAIKTFDVDTQRTLYPVPDVRLLPAREFPLDEAGRDALSRALPRGVRGRSVAPPLYKDVRNGVVPGGIEYYLPLFFDATARSPTTCPRAHVVARMATCTARSSGSGTTPNRATSCCAATASRRCCRRRTVFLPPTRSAALLKRFAARRAPRTGARAR